MTQMKMTRFKRRTANIGARKAPKNTPGCLRKQLHTKHNHEINVIIIIPTRIPYQLLARKYSVKLTFLQ